MKNSRSLTGMKSAGVSFVSQLSELLKLYSRYMIRSVMTKGILRRKEIRWAVAGLALLWLVSSFAISYMMYRRIEDIPSYFWSELFAITWLGATGWILVFFLVLKVLFGRATGLAELTEQLPVSGRLKAVSFQFFEMLILLGGIVFLIAPPLANMIIFSGADAVYLTSFHLILPAVLLYALLNVVWQSVCSFMLLLKIPQYASVVGVSVLTIAMAYDSAVMQHDGLVKLIDHYISGSNSFYWITAVADAASHIGGFACFVLCAAVIAFLIFLGLLLTPKYYRMPDSFVYIPLPAVAKNDFMLFLSYIVRHSVNLETLFLSVCIAVSFFCSHDYPSIMICPFLLVFSAAYQFANGIEEQWRMKRGDSAGWLYLCLLVSQVLYAGLFWLVSAAFLAATGHFEASACLYSFLAVIAGSIIFTFLGILFPSAKNNPFTVIAGVSSFMIFVLAVILGLSVFNLSALQMQACGGVMLIFFAVYSVMGIQADIKRRKIGKN
ncbi:MAG: hypothetical protein U0L31_04425 [Bifidobacteriaceae bacterium]|nr:hypothetical protein [Bifidobacteriaceae bacterium]